MKAPMPETASPAAIANRHDRIPFEKHDRNGLVAALLHDRAEEGEVTGPQPHRPFVLEQVVYTRRTVGIQFERWGSWQWRVYVASEDLWVARRATYARSLHPPPEFADAPLVAMPGEPGHHRRIAGQVRGTVAPRQWELLT